MSVKAMSVKSGLLLAGLLLAGSISANDKPVQLAQLTEGFDAEKTYQQSCFACHSSGAAGAPRVGNAEEWAPRIAKGMDALMTSTINGVNAMPAKGLCFTCTEDDLKAVVEYMISKSKPE